MTEEQNQTKLKNLKENLGDRMKKYEQQCPKQVPSEKPFIARLDGHSFSKFTKGFKQPFDPIFVDAMVATTDDLIKKFNARTGYTHSDEITIIFNRALTPEDENRNKVHMFNGRTTKLNTLLASYCSVRFNYHLINLLNEQTFGEPDLYPKSLIDKVNAQEAHFDSRIMVFPEDYEIANHMIWRSCRDCIRNCISTYGRYYLGHKYIHKKTSTQIVEMLKQSGFDWDSVPIYLKHGVYAKNELYKKEEESGIKCTRSRITNVCFVVKSDDQNIKFLLDKYMDHDFKVEPISFSYGQRYHH